MEYDSKRLFHGYYLDEWGTNKINGAYQLGCHPCDLCDLSDLCDRIADDINHIEYCICLEKTRDYKNDHPDTYYKKLDSEI